MEPVLICGQPRSGTTLLRSLLDGHPGVAVFPMEAKIVTTGMADPGLTASQVLDHVLERGDDRMDLAALRTAVHDDLGEGPGAVGLGALTEATVTAYARLAGVDGARYWVDKTPMTERYLSELVHELPALKALYVVRDPRDVLLSLRTRRSYDVRTHVRGWITSVLEWDRFVARHGRGLTVRYEDLATDTEQEMRRVATFLDLPFEPVLVAPTVVGRPWAGNSSRGPQGAQVTAASIGRWRTDLDPEDARLVTQACAPALRRFGYDADAPRARGAVAVLARANLAWPAGFRAARSATRVVRRAGPRRPTTVRPWP